MLGNYYRGRLSFNEIKNLPAGEFKIYWVKALEELQSKQGRARKQTEVVEDELTDGSIM